MQRALHMPMHVRPFQVSFCFVFFTMAEYTLANTLMRIEGRVRQKVVAAEKRLRDRADQADLGVMDLDAMDVMNAMEHKQAPWQIDTEAVLKHPGKTEGSTANRQSSSKNQGITSEQLRAEVMTSLKSYEKALVCKNPKAGGDGTLWIMDQHCDIFCRMIFPLAYITVLVVFFSMTPTQPTMSPFLQKACVPK